MIAHAMRAVLPDNAVSVALKKGGSCAAIGIYSRSIPCLFPQHGRGPKHKRKIALLDWQRMIAVQDRLVVLLPDAWPEFRDRGLAHAEQGHTALAVIDLETYLVHAQDALDIDAIADRVADLRRARS